jgi:hypothetical protein
MSFLSDKNKIIHVLFIFAVLFLAANLLFDKLHGKKPAENTELSIEEINIRFNNALSNLGMSEDWIKKKKEDEDHTVLQVQVPNDLPVALILQEMNNVFKPDETEFHSIEKTIGGKTILNISSGNEIKLTAEFSYNKKIRRKTVRIGFLVTGLGVKEETDSLLLNYPESFAALLIPSRSSAEFVKKTARYNKEYIVYLNDEITELGFKLSDSYSERRLKNSIRSIVGSFSKAIFFLVDDNSNLYSSSIFPFIKDEIEKRKIRLVEQSRFKWLTNTPEENLASNFSLKLESIAGGEDELFIISSSDLVSLQNETASYRKRGYKFTNPSALSF